MVETVPALFVRYRLPAPLIVGTGVLGTSVPTSLDGDPIIIHMPWVESFELQPPSVLDELALTKVIDPTTHMDMTWGYPSDLEEPASYAVDALLFEVRSPSDGGLKRLVTLAPGWFDRLRVWVEVLCAQDLDYHTPRKRLQLPGVGFTAWSAGSEVDVPWGTVHFDFDYGTPITVDRWIHILGLVGTGTEPAVEHTLLRSAELALVRKQIRRAVADAGTALEIALYRLLELSNLGGGSKLADVVLADDLWQATRLFNVARKVTAVPSSLRQEHITLRNKMLHKDAKLPTIEKAAEMVAAVRDVVELATPLPTSP
jgi:hypothetical protein